jgi:teichuronic acid biosynthesis glycosyltransferase TuaG
MLDMQRLDKGTVYMPLIKRGQDTATWWKILKIIDNAYGLNEIFSYYRRTDESLSANKLIAIKRTWNLYRGIENMGAAQSVYNFSWYVINAIERRR